MKIAVMGSGGVGGYFGARLATSGADVTFVARGGHLAAMREHGLTVEGGPDEIRLPPVNAVADPAAIGTVDLVIFAVKLSVIIEQYLRKLPIPVPILGATVDFDQRFATAVKCSAFNQE